MATPPKIPGAGDQAQKREPDQSQMPSLLRHPWARRSAMRQARRASEIRELPEVTGLFVGAGWRRVQTSYITELRAWIDALETRGDLTDADKAVLAGVTNNLNDAWIAATRRVRTAEERTHTNICAAETGLLRVVPADDLPGWLPTVRQAVRKNLSKSDSVRRAVDEFIRRFERAEDPGRLIGENRELLVKGLQAAYYADSIEKRRANSFRNVVYIGAGVLTLLAVGLGFTASAPDQPLFRLCFPGTNPQACPTGYLSPAPAANGATGATARAVATAKATASSDPDPGTATTTATAIVIASAHPSAQGSPQEVADSAPEMPDQEGFDVLIVEAFGLVAAALTAAVALRKMNRTRPPYSVPLALVLLKLPAGAVSAVLGVMLINGGLIPGLDKLETPNQILSWAALFGASQQALTRFVDKKGRDVLQIQGSDRGGGKDRKGRGRGGGGPGLPPPPPSQTGAKTT